MQKLLVLILALTLLSGAAAQTTGEKIPDATPNWGRITDSTYSIRFPGNWTVDQSGQFGSRFFLFSPLDSLNDTFRENFNLIINDMGAYPKTTLEYLADGAKQQVERMINDCKVQEYRIVHHGDDKYYLFEYSGKQGQFNLHWKQMYYLWNHRFYVLTFTAEEHQYARYLPVAERILASFTLQ